MAAKQAFEGRAARLRKKLEDEDLGGIVVVPGPNMKYFTDVDSFLLERPFMLLLPADGGAQLVAPELEAGPYRRSPLRMTVHSWTDAQGPSDALARATKAAGFKGRWGVEGRAPFAYIRRLGKHGKAKLKDAEPVLQGLRERKDEDEMKLLRKSADIMSRSFSAFPELLKEGMTELEFARAATDVTYRNGATKTDDMLVQSGERAADPHALPSTKKIGRGESIIVDVGVTYAGYYSDMTRTFCLGSSKDVERVYQKVLEAQEAAIRTSGDGVPVGKVDGGARGVLEKASLGKFFIHRTGHGLGLEVHEAPYIVTGGKERLGKGMCFTVEPGAYLPGKLGVRIEDDVLITGKKGEEITSVPKEYGWWS